MGGRAAGQWEGAVPGAAAALAGSVEEGVAA